MPEWIESIESQSLGTSGGRGTGSRTFFAVGYETAAEVLASLGTTVGGVVVPTKGDAFADGLYGLVARDFQLSKEPGHTDLWRVVWTYEVVERNWFNVPTFDVTTEYPQEVGYVELSSEIRTEFYNAWRLEASQPTDGTPDDADIGGTPVDTGGSPTSIQRRRQELVLTETINGEPDYSVFEAFTFKRNSTTFLGAAKGRVLYRGASVRRTGLYVYTVAHSFVDDQFSHCEQQPVIDQNGIAIDQNGDGHADTVLYYQPFPDFADFNTLSGNF